MYQVVTIKPHSTAGILPKVQNMVSISNSLNDQPSSVKELLATFDIKFVASYYQWVIDQFDLAVYRPSDRNVFLFIARTLKDFTKHHDLLCTINWDDFLSDWEIDESFNDFFQS